MCVHHCSIRWKYGIEPRPFSFSVREIMVRIGTRIAIWISYIWFGTWVERCRNRAYEECNSYPEIFSLVWGLDAIFAPSNIYFLRKSHWVPLAKAKTYDILVDLHIFTSYIASFNNCQIFHWLSKQDISGKLGPSHSCTSLETKGETPSFLFFFWEGRGGCTHATAQQRKLKPRGDFL